MKKQSRNQWRSQPRNLGGAKMFDFRRITLFCLKKRLSKHKHFLGGMAPLPPPGYAYARNCDANRTQNVFSLIELVSRSG